MEPIRFIGCKSPERRGKYGSKPTDVTRVAQSPSISSVPSSSSPKTTITRKKRNPFLSDFETSLVFPGLRQHTRSEKSANSPSSPRSRSPRRLKTDKKQTMETGAEESMKEDLKKRRESHVKQLKKEESVRRSLPELDMRVWCATGPSSAKETISMNSPRFLRRSLSPTPSSPFAPSPASYVSSESPYDEERRVRWEEYQLSKKKRVGKDFGVKSASFAKDQISCRWYLGTSPSYDPSKEKQYFDEKKRTHSEAIRNVHQAQRGRPIALHAAREEKIYPTPLKM